MLQPNENTGNDFSANLTFKLPVKTDVNKLYADLQTCQKAQWKEHFNTRDYSGNWSVISLRSQTGSANDILAHNSSIPFINTPLLEKCTYFKEVLDGLFFEKETVRLLCLQPGSIIKEHRDMGLAYRYGCFRLHIPIITEASVKFIVGKKNIPMKKGECWYSDFDLPHSVINESTQERIHLVIDGKRNAWTDELFAACGYDFEEEKRMDEHSVETKKKMIENLRYVKTATADEMIKKLELEINKSLTNTKHAG